jgi:uncharacterized iron-regulated protein
MQRRSIIRALALASLSTLPVPFTDAATRAVVKWRSALLRDHPLVGRIWDSVSARFVSSAVLYERVAIAQFHLLGEVHDNPDHHAIQAEILEAIGTRGLKPLVAFEQFDREHADALRQRLASGTHEPDDIAQAVMFDRKGWNWDFYRALVAIALRYGMPIRAANLSRNAASQIAKRGFAALGAERAAELQIEKVWSTEREQVLREIIREGHCGALPESAVPALAAAQRARDATLAESLRGDSPDGAVLIAGNGHVRRDLGVPLYLPGSSCAVGILEVEADKESAADYLESAAGAVPLYDLVCFTPRWERPDPCAAFQNRK